MKAEGRAKAASTAVVIVGARTRGQPCAVACRMLACATTLARCLPHALAGAMC